MANETKITIELTPETFKKVEALAKDEKRTLENEAACLLEKGIRISEATSEKPPSNGA